MQLAKPLRSNPRAVAEQLVAALKAQPAFERWVSALEIAGPGFINLRLAPAAKQAVVAEVLAAPDAFGRQPANGQKLMVEFVSANPTGPLHVGHARQGAGRQPVQPVPDPGLGRHPRVLLQRRGRADRHAGQLHPVPPQGPEARRRRLARKCLQRRLHCRHRRRFPGQEDGQGRRPRVHRLGRSDDLDGIRQFAVAYLRHEQDLDLQAFSVQFDNYYLESSLYTSGRVEKTVKR
jgi:arginyl-tRNA synthetase